MTNAGHFAPACLLFSFVVVTNYPLFAEDRYVTTAVQDADEMIRKQMREKWTTPQRLRWTISYHPIKGMTDMSAWHIKGTIWRVRLNPNWLKLDEFDKTVEYELDSVALNQNYGVIDFYVYDHQKVK
jgi:hypothetical protein